MSIPESDDLEYGLSVAAGSEPMRLDAWLASQLIDYSRNRLKELILSGAATVNGETVSEPKFKVKAGDSVFLAAPAPEDPDPQPEDIPLVILFEDEHLIVIDKPAGMVVHPAPGSPSGTLVNALLFHCGEGFKGIGGVRRPGIVHRLDKDTSGVMVVAKTEKALKHLAAQFADHGRTGPLERAYTAWVWGRMQTHTGTVEAPLGRDVHNRFKQAVRRDGREAITHYQVEARIGGDGWDITRVTCMLETGRTHQIRVHMAYAGHPLVADPVYSTGYATKANVLPEGPRAIINTLGRQALHARLLGFEHPATGEEMLFEADAPDDLQALDKALAPFDRAFATNSSQR